LALGLKIPQVNMGYRCNMTCKHCHVSGGPARTEVMDKKTVETVLGVLRDNPIETLDITGGAPELNPSFRTLVAGARHAGRHVIVRTNLTIFLEEGMGDLPEYYRDQNVELIASLPYYLEDGVDRVRGSGVFRKSISALQKLNSLGYGSEASGPPLSLVFNPQGIFLPPPQSSLEAEYRRELKDQFGISFTHLYTFANMPIGRFRDFLAKTGHLEKYLARLSGAFNPRTLEGIMCRHLISVGWDGTLYDCDFNRLPESRRPRSPHINEFDYGAVPEEDRRGRPLFGCTARQDRR
jgi:radical SAM/Cys-rich protein